MRTVDGRRRPGWRGGVIWTALLLCVPAAWADCKLSQLEIPVRIVNKRPIGTLTLNGTEVPLLVDSGAFFSMLAPSTATQLGLRTRPLPEGLRINGYTGSIRARMTTVERVGLRGNELRNIQFVVGGNELGSGIMGILGRNFLAIGDTEYDLAHGVMRLMFPKGECRETNLAYWAGEAPVIVAALKDTSDKATEARLPVKVNGVKMTALLDSGAPLTALALSSAKRAGVKEADLKEIGRAGGAGEGFARSFTGKIDSFEIEGEKILDNVLRIDDVDWRNDDLLLGMDYFLSHRIYVSRLQGKLYATWNGGPVFARGGPTEHYDARYAAKPADVAADDAEALARRGEAAAARGELAKALEDLDRACELAPTAEANFLARARVHLAMRNNAKARADLDRALTLQPALHEALALRASLRVGARDRNGALADLAVLDGALPPSAQLREQMAQIYARMELAPEALRQWELWLPSHQRDARLARVLNSRCWLRVRFNLDLKLALEDCKAAVSEDGDEAAYRESLGWAWLRLNEPRKAVDAFDGSIERKPRPFAHYGRALAQTSLGRSDAARRDLADARRLMVDVDERVRRQGLPVADDAPQPAASAASGAQAPAPKPD